MTDSLFQTRFEDDTNLLNGDVLVRVFYRREGVWNWSRFVVVLDGETTRETVEANVETLIAAHEGLR